MGINNIKLGYNQTFSYELPWLGKKLRSTRANPIAFDTETEVVEEGIPRVALITASNGSQSCVIHPRQLCSFIEVHRFDYWVGHNTPFDFWVIDKYLKSLSQHLSVVQEAISNWWRIVDEGRMFDTMILDMLYRLAKGDGEKGGDPEIGIWPRNLGEVAKEFSNVPVNKEDPFRMRYEELLTTTGFRDWDDPTIDRGFWDYAISDSIATAKSYNSLYIQSKNFWDTFKKRIPEKSSEIQINCLDRYGLLTETLQVKAAIALHYMEKQGINIHRERVQILDNSYREQVDDVIEYMRCVWPTLFKYIYPKKPRKCKKNEAVLLTWKDPPLGELPLQKTKKTDLPSLNTTSLKEILSSVAEELEVDVPMSTGKTGDISKSIKSWTEHRNEHPFLQAWSLVAESSKLLSFISIAKEREILRPRYGLLKTTGRTSSYGPNLQQWPRQDSFRAIFIPRPGYKLLAIDYSYIELRTLAAVCYARLGRSVLGDVIKEGRDPHIHTASLVSNRSYGDLENDLKEPKGSSKQKNAKHLRQSAKAINFGVPGGLGARKLVLYSKCTYGVDFTLDEADQLRQRLIYEIYPELSDKDGYLADESFRNLSININVPLKVILKTFEVGPENFHLCGRALGKILKGTPIKNDGTPYKEFFVERMWSQLNYVIELSSTLGEDLKDKIRLKEPSKKLFRTLLGGNSVTLTGRMRGGVDYTQQKNTPFQGIAADGGKMALWNMLKEGIRIIGFVHDEILCEVPEDSIEHSTNRIQTIMEESMEKILGNCIPISTEYVIGDYWIKG